MTRPESSRLPATPTQTEPSGPIRGEKSPWWRLLAAVLIGLAGILLSVVGWKALRSTERARIESGLESTATGLASAFEAALGLQLEHLQDLGHSWGVAGTEDSDRWRADAKLFRELNEECLVLEWDPRSPPSTPLVSGTPEAMSLLVTLHDDSAAESARHVAVSSRTEASLGPWADPDGRPIVETLIPVAVAEDQVSVLTALIDPAVALDRMAGTRDEDFALEVLWGRVPLFRRGEPAGGELSGLVEERSFRAGSPGTEWSVAVRPSRKLLASPQQLLQWMVLIGGIVVSMLIAITFWVGQVAMLRNRDLFGATVALQEQGRELERAGEKARKLDERITAVREERRILMMSLKAEMEARASGAASDPAVSELETFTYSVSHDLRSPMGAILNYAAVLAEDYHDALGPEGQEYLRRISSSAQRAIGMMDGLLAFSRVGRQELKLAEVDVARMVREIHAELCQSRPGARPVLSMGDLPPIEGDQTLLWTLFSNLLSNAFKFTQGVQDPRVQVGGYVQGPDVVYYVEDNGIGFDMRHASKLFGVFERLPSGEHHEGHGVGLAVVERIARRHGGSVRAEGVPGKGATFFVTLPTDPLHPDRGMAAETTTTS